jgi:hypothetical protein
MSERGRDFFIMSLARELRMTRRQLLYSMDSYEMTMWEAYLKEVNKPPEPPKEDPKVLAEKLKAAFSIHGSKKRKKK